MKGFGNTDSVIVVSYMIPRYYGTIENLDPKLYQPHLNDFLEDEYPPKAILLEYIPNMQMLYWTNYTKKGMDNFIKGLQQIHEALVEHSDVYDDCRRGPRKGNLDRF
ncbi:hypothetical protein Egran_00815 [Elaphomyces granulatus]|uniref:Protein kinase domain-containing protein n=1 Tax=Elaphomyces granulatus TaxID=519963 RepID=A0A232M572_9EURO|nr:hypothetical protein Egran_00815 [Elaphomyces granulatus]